MLIVNSPFNRMVPNNLNSFNTNRYYGNIFRHDPNYNSHYIEVPYVGDLFLPFIINNIDLKQEVLVIDREYLNANNFPATDIKNKIDDIVADTTDNKIRWIKIYCPVSFKDRFEAIIDPDIWTGVNDNIIEMTNKVNQQLELREELDYTPEMKFYKHRVCNVVIQLLDTMDTRQATEDFYFMGLIPQLFPDFGENLTVEEHNFFDELVHRAQLKRIGNADAQNLFAVMCNSEKYLTKIKEVQLRVMVDTIAENKVRAYRQTVQAAESRMSDIMREYDSLLKTHREQNILLMNQMETIDETKEEILSAINTEGVIKCEADGNNRLSFYVKAPITFYEQEMLESLLSNDRLCMDPIVREFFTKIFINQEYRLIVAQRFSFSFALESSFSLPSVDERECANLDASINPHLAFYSCLGNYKPTLVKLQKEQNLLMFIHTAIASTKSINFADGAVFGRWNEYLKDKFTYEYSAFLDAKCLEDAEGNLFTPREVFLTEPEEEIEIVEENESELEIEELDVYDSY